MTTMRREHRPPLVRTTVEPDLERLAATVARVYLEVEAGRRPATQLDRVASPSLRRRLRLVAARRRDLARRRRQPVAGPGSATVVRVWSSRPREHAMEATVVVQVAGRARAVCVRFERHHGTWRIVELATPDSGDRPRRTASCPVARPCRDTFDEVLDGLDDEVAGPLEPETVPA